MMVAAAASEQLTDTAKTRAAEPLKLNPQYGNWVNGIVKEARMRLLSSEPQRRRFHQALECRLHE
jgi:hypothetical protein